MQRLEHHDEAATDEKSTHGAQDLSHAGYCCGDSLLVCKECGHRGMKTIGIESLGATKDLRCPECGHYATCSFDIEEGNSV